MTVRRPGCWWVSEASRLENIGRFYTVPTVVMGIPTKHKKTQCTIFQGRFSDCGWAWLPRTVRRAFVDGLTR